MLMPPKWGGFWWIWQLLEHGVMYCCGCSATGSAGRLAWGPDISPRWQKRGGQSRARIELPSLSASLSWQQHEWNLHTHFVVARDFCACAILCMCFPKTSGTGRLLVTSTDPLATRWPGCWTTEIRRGSKRLRLRSSSPIVYRTQWCLW